ncbi:methionine synthase [Actinomycetospora sp. NBRC 106375]|uniref:cobalamin-independent methionine synthase II family protein n=1 Tax=Actinomycetospora sp. NBRC 106375 TaxID=3032207 RepID=UPI0024A4F99A|nr:cobalamin-independent methionine synthase II family protein [Actinomycetospora sp. NBRC 106375]GLZ50202.1 methionine synthase [Actinomycetospora sp. NBRC 106375]
MRRSDERILTTHTGSLPRPDDLRALFARGDVHGDDFVGSVRRSVTDVVGRQTEAGVDVLNDGEMSKESYSTYVRERLSGFDGEGEAVLGLSDLMDFPDFMNRWMQLNAADVGDVLAPPACTGPIAVKDHDQVRVDIENLRAATAGGGATEVFMSAASPGVVAAFFANHHYPTREEYLRAIGAAMREEYEAIVDAGFVLQLDCPDLAMCRHLQWQDRSLEEFRAIARQDVEVLNEATAGIDPDRMRIHLCWGNYEGPHHHDVALRDIVDIVLEARPNGIALEAANPRHEHEWQVFEDVALPDGKVLIPGVIDSTMNYIEHPELIAQRLVRYGRLVGRPNVLAGSDCGFGTAAQQGVVSPDIVWAKCAAMAEGARLATAQL